jgi:hypothetical protein
MPSPARAGIAGIIMVLAHEFLGWGRSKPAVPADLKTAGPSSPSID